MANYGLTYLGEDRLAVCLAFAIAGHVALIFGVAFSPGPPKKTESRLEITLASFNSDNAPDKADFLAQADQIGSGTLEHKAELTTTKLSELQGLEIKVAEQQKLSAKVDPVASVNKIISTVSATLYKAPKLIPKEQTPKKKTSQGDSKQEQLSQQIASLEAKLARQQQAYAKRPRIYRITSAATKAAEDAAYQLTWQQKVEQAGNRNYPAQARKEELQGDVRLMVALLPDGSIQKVKVLASSGNPLLDSAAVRSVHLASPFAPFPPKLSRKADILEIIRTWQFRRDRFSSKE